MKLFIPTIGSEMVLSKACPVTIHSEHRNSKFLSSLGIGMDQKYINKTYGNLFVENQSLVDRYKAKVSLKEVSITIPAGTVLKVNRIYIRQVAEDFDSMTFQCDGNKDFPKGRFWLKLTDVNTFNIQDPKPIADIQRERKISFEENQKKMNIALYNRFQRFSDKIQEKGQTIDALVRDKVKNLLDRSVKSGINVGFHAEMYANNYEDFLERLKILKEGKGDSMDRKSVSDFLYKLEHPDKF